MPAWTPVDSGQGIFFDILPPVRELEKTFQNLLYARKVFLRDLPRGEGRARALAIDTVIDDMKVSLNRAALLTAQEATQIVERNIRSTHSGRPQAPGRRGGIPLEQAIVSRPIPTPLPFGTVGIGEVATLDKVTDADGQTYWRAQEFGSDHRVSPFGPGRGTLKGLFQPGNVPASAGNFRAQAYFDVDEAGGVKTLFVRPIPRRLFLTKALPEAEVFRQKRLGDAVVRATADMAAVRKGTHPELRALRALVARRGR